MSVVPSSAAQATAWRTRTLPAPEEVRPGLWALAVPVPTPIVYTLCYVLVADHGLLVIDPGWPDDASRDGLVAGLRALGATPADVTDVVVTHLHPDHAGLAGWLLDRAPDASLAMHPEDLDRLLPQGQQRRTETDRVWSAYMATVGAPEALAIGTRALVMPPLTAAQADRARALGDGEHLRHGDWDLETVWTPGHTRGSLVLLERRHRLLISGDHILPTVTPAVSQQADAEHDILGDFLRSLLRVRDLPADEVLPGHQYRFRGLADRVDAMVDHHRRRLTELESAVAGQPGASCYDLTQQLRWSTSDFGALSRRDRAMAARETLAHLTHLRLAGRVTAHDTAPATSWFGGGEDLP
ncbi:MBL fold metallo-hydrolase [Nocardioides pantholopis]|uniref:MBL fold metallo-hydrolase n=1 Tax=Nocardioides pantholopis TaxID=2483798 RepID=UPI0013DDCCE1|nr:MBL fold metallo-hydrolase [Nocardioides pantholopis]